VDSWLNEVHGAKLANLSEENMHRLAANDIQTVVAWTKVGAD